MGGFIHLISTIFYPLEWIISWIMWACHWVLVRCGMAGGSGFAWCLSIIFMTMIVRACIFPLYTKQINAMAKMQAMQPELAKINAKYKGKKDPASQEARQRETMQIYKEAGSNPLTSCLPMLVQGPVFIALYDSLFNLSSIATGKIKPLGAFTRQVASQIENTVFINVKLSALFGSASGGGKWTIGIITAFMCVSMFYMTFYTMHYNTPIDQLKGKGRKAQWGMAIGMPLLYIWSAAIAPFGVLIYWLTTNIWSLLQTLWQVNRFPVAGSRAGEKKKARDLKKEIARRAKKGLPTIEEEEEARVIAEQEQKSVQGYQRVQPVRKKSKKKGK
ncbi:MAG: membrane protein insertase YidC [Aeriscardovia sp.]|nr:membrane protein insertase YidC [Aeriscardovia sp.]